MDKICQPNQPFSFKFPRKPLDKLRQCSDLFNRNGLNLGLSYTMMMKREICVFVIFAFKPMTRTTFPVAT